jgi:hypothetical protein
MYRNKNTLLICSIHQAKEVVSFPVRGADRYGMIRDLPQSVSDFLPTFLCFWEIHTDTGIYFLMIAYIVFQVPRNAANIRFDVHFSLAINWN